MINNSTVVLLTMLLTVTTYAVPNSAKADWSGDIEGGTVLQGDEKGSLLRFKMFNSERPLNQQFYADWIRGDSGSDTYKVGYEPQYWFSDKTYVFGDASLLTSKDTGIDQERNLFAGVGLQLLNNATQNLFAEVGKGQTSTKLNAAASMTATGSTTKEFESTVARIGASQVLTDFFKLELDGDYSESDDKVKRTTAEAGISFRVPGGAIKYTYRERSIDQDGLDKVKTKDSFVSYSYGF